MSLASDFLWDSVVVVQIDKQSGFSGEIKRAIYMHTQKNVVQDEDV